MQLLLSSLATWQDACGVYLAHGSAAPLDSLPGGRAQPLAAHSSLPHQPASVWWTDGTDLRATFASDSHFYFRVVILTPSFWDNLTSLLAVFPIGFWYSSETWFPEGRNPVPCERAYKQGPG